MDFILEMQAKAEVRMAKLDEQMAKADERMAKAEARADRADARGDKFDKRLEATRKLVELGMRLLVKNGKDFDREMHELVEAQKRTDRKLDRLIDFGAWRRSNGSKSHAGG